MRAGERPSWDALTVACIASGPSLTREDCDAVRSAGLRTVVTNSTFRAAPWADIVFGFDMSWWRAHLQEVRASCTGRLMTVSQIGPHHGVESLYGSRWFTQHGNSGTCAVAIAVGAGAKRIILLGYDCGPGPAGQMHWHADHPRGLTNCASMAAWPKQFQRLEKFARRAGVEVLNASRATTLAMFRRAQLEDLL